MDNIVFTILAFDKIAFIRYNWNKINNEINKETKKDKTGNYTSSCSSWIWVVLFTFVLRRICFKIS